MYFYDTIDDTFQRTKPILDDLTPITLYRGGGRVGQGEGSGGQGLATKVCVVLESSSQGANGVKENRPLLVCVLTLNSMFGKGACQPHRMSRTAGCRFLLAAFWPASREGPWTGKESGDAKSHPALRKLFVLIVLQMTK